MMISKTSVLQRRSPETDSICLVSMPNRTLKAMVSSMSASTMAHSACILLDVRQADLLEIRKISHFHMHAVPIYEIMHDNPQSQRTARRKSPEDNSICLVSMPIPWCCGTVHRVYGAAFVAGGPSFCFPADCFDHSQSGGDPS
jgi:hypothetical protein